MAMDAPTIRRGLLSMLLFSIVQVSSSTAIAAPSVARSAQRIQLIRKLPTVIQSKDPQRPSSRANVPASAASAKTSSIGPLDSLNGATMTPVLYQPIKLPVWPVWSGVLAQVADWLHLPAASDAILSSVGGRVVPMSLQDMNLSPFLLLAHHTHSFTPFDPIRALSGAILPEGFPAHPHAGFDTVTFCLEGGLRHRDSEGVSMSYGDGQVQWMRAGRGMIHEEMWDLFDQAINNRHKRIEIFQLWINLRDERKMDAPLVRVLTQEEIPHVYSTDGSLSVRVIAGELCLKQGMEERKGQEEAPSTESESQTSDINGVNGGVEGTGSVYRGPGSEVAASPLSMLYVTERSAYSALHFSVRNNNSNPSSSRNIDGSAGAGLGSAHSNKGGSCTVLVYVRSGSLVVNAAIVQYLNGKRPTEKELKLGVVEVRRGDALIFVEGGMAPGGESAFVIETGGQGFQGLVLTGEPLGERVVARGPFVQASESQLYNRAAAFEKAGYLQATDSTLENGRSTSSSRSTSTGGGFINSAAGGNGSEAVYRSPYWDHRTSDAEWLKHCDAMQLQRVLSAGKAESSL